ncbi:MAG: class I SAM-dependent methyltransferase [Acidobacteria bacterium]|nr:class I SAM-dependent methyltransferase [Acidobacteriota bacterium]
MAAALTETQPFGNQWGPLGRALLDFHRGATDARIIVHTDLWHDEITPVAEFYRPDRQPLPEIERAALGLCHGRTLDLGAGAGRHALELQRRGLEVTAVDVSPEAVHVMRERGVEDARHGNLDAVAGEEFGTILLLMHGIGLVGTLGGLTEFFDRARRHLEDGGQVIFDTADLGLVMPARFEEEIDVWRSGGPYPGEVEYRLSYEGFEGEPYRWLFVDPVTLVEWAAAADCHAEIVARGNRGTFLARITA